MGRWRSVRPVGCDPYPPSAATGWSCSSASLGCGSARAPPGFRGGKTPPKPISEQLPWPTSPPFPPPATLPLGTKPGVKEHGEASPRGQEGPPGPGAGNRPAADVQAHPDGASRTARRQAGPPGMAPMIPQQKGAPRSSGHHPAGVTPHDKDGSPQGFHVPEKGQGTRKKGLGGGKLGVRPSPPGHPVTSGARALLVLRRRAHGRCQLQGRGAGLRAEEGGGRFLSAPRGDVRGQAAGWGCEGESQPSPQPGVVVWGRPRVGMG